MLTKDYSNKIEFEGEQLTINDSYDNCLLFIEMLQDDELDTTTKIALGCDMMTDAEFITHDMSVTHEIVKLNDLLERIIQHVFPNEGSQENVKKVYDFSKDGEMIYASFLQDYNIDLLDQKGNMSFQKFIYLLRQLSKDTPFKTALSYRLTKVPKQTKHNKEQVEHVKKMKKFYALDTTDEKPVNNDHKLKSAFEAFKR